ncbi:hypothetical protein RI129_007234 [Pyrocoelia pectoralis]|uniref:WKF domain-containing protein n=1 Tax=Pyrocoelia pectoralis TaxID=417401 RepID=A0AAN7VBZ6_9COLE
MDDEVKTTISKKKKNSNKICFDAEVVPQNVAEALKNRYKECEKPAEPVQNMDSQIFQVRKKNTDVISDKSVKVKKRSKQISNKEPSQNVKKQKKDTDIEKTINNTQTSDVQDDLETENSTKIKKKESNRAKKKIRHMELLLDKKIKTDNNNRESNLNYLSKWKHSRNDWKFEKRRQLWLKQNMFDVEKIPDDFWDIFIEYFSNAKGNVRKNILDEALKIIESNDREEKEDILFNRARSIVQCLQE